MQQPSVPTYNKVSICSLNFEKYTPFLQKMKLESLLVSRDNFLTLQPNLLKKTIARPFMQILLFFSRIFLVEDFQGTASELTNMYNCKVRCTNRKSFKFE